MYRRARPYTALPCWSSPVKPKVGTLHEPLAFHDGALHIPTAPGLNATANDATLARFHAERPRNDKDVV